MGTPEEKMVPPIQTCHLSCPHKPSALPQPLPGPHLRDHRGPLPEYGFF